MNELKTSGVVVDGDTIKVPEYGSIRLAGIDAPENGQPAIDARGRRIDAGEAATQALVERVRMRRREGFKPVIEGDADNRGKYGRIIAYFSMRHPDGRTEDMCAWMVRSGYAVAEYGEDYRHLERIAQSEGRGLWSGQWQRPSEWRRERRGGFGPAKRSVARRRRRSRRSSLGGLGGWISFFRAMSRLFRAFK